MNTKTTDQSLPAGARAGDGIPAGCVLVQRGLLKEARDNAEASCAESGVSHGRLEYRKELVQRLDAVLAVSAQVGGAERPRPGIGRLWDSQWVNIVNAPEVLAAEDAREAVHLAVKLTEARMAANFAEHIAAAPAVSAPAQPVAWCQLTANGQIAYFDGKPMVMPGPVGNECHPDPLYPRTIAAAPAWQPIETAPKNGRSVLVWDAAPNGGCAVGRVLKYPGRPDSWINPGGHIVRPTHWMPLPAAPAFLSPVTGDVA